jgi:DNA-binding XRE family transcriptional regulator
MKAAKYKLIEKPLISLPQDPNDMLTASLRIEFLRCLFGYPVNIFANKIHTPVQFTEKICKGESDPSLRTLEVIAMTFPVKNEWLFLNTGDPLTVEDYTEYIYVPGKHKKQETIDEGLINRFIEVRSDNNMTQLQFASVLNITHDILKSIEARRAPITIWLLKKFIEVFGVMDEYALWGTGNKYKEGKKPMLKSPVGLKSKSAVGLKASGESKRTTQRAVKKKKK